MALGLGLGVGLSSGISIPPDNVDVILANLGGADYTPLADYSNCWQMADGTLPCTADTQVGRIHSTTATLGSELAPGGGTFDSATGWFEGAWVIGSNVATVTSATGGNVIRPSSNPGITNKSYKITFTIVSLAAGTMCVYAGGTSGTTRSATGTYTEYVTCGSTNAIVGIMALAVGTTGVIDNVSIKEVIGFFATQATAGYKPFLRDKFSYAPVVSAIGETWTFTGTPIAGRAGIRIDASGEKYFASINTAGNFASTPDSAATSLTGDQTHIFCIAPDSWDNDAEQYIAGKYGASGQRAFTVHIDASSKLVFTTFSADGATAIAHTSTTAMSALFTAGQKVTLRAVLDVDNGATGHDLTYSYSLNYDQATKTGTWTTIDATITTAGTTAVKDTTAIMVIGSIAAATATNLVGKIYYYAAYANLTGTGTPSWEFYPQRDSVNFPMQPYLDYDGSDDRLETNIAPGSYDAGYLCGGWTQMKAIGSGNVMFGSSLNTAVRGVSSYVLSTGFAGISRRTGVNASATSSDPNQITPYVPFVSSASYTPTSETMQLNSFTKKTSTASLDYRGTTQVALLGTTNNAESGVTPLAAFMQGYQFAQIWLPTIPTAEQQAILRAYCASKAGVTL